MAIFIALRASLVKMIRLELAEGILPLIYRNNDQVFDQHDRKNRADSMHWGGFDFLETMFYYIKAVFDLA